MTDLIPVPTGTRTPWRMLDDGLDDSSLWLRDDGWYAGTVGLLAEALRSLGPVASLGPALQLAGTAELSLGWIGCDEDGDEFLLDGDGEILVTVDDERAQVGSVRKCVIARVHMI